MNTTLGTTLNKTIETTLKTTTELTKCDAGYYGPNCKPCNCKDPFNKPWGTGYTGSCDSAGTCYCKPRVISKDCSKCADDLYFYPNCFGKCRLCTVKL